MGDDITLKALMYTTPSDVNFKTALENCSNEQLATAIKETRKALAGNAARLKVLESRARARKLVV